MCSLPGRPGRARRDLFRLTPPRITAAVSPTDGRVCAFTLDRSVTEESRLCRSADGALGSPLFEALFALPEVRQVWAVGSRVTVARSVDTDWKEWAPRVGAALRRALADPRPPIAPAPTVSAGDLTPAVRDLLLNEINPGLAQHGGRVELVDIQDNVARVRFSGGCQGCGAAQMTLSQGVRRSLLDRFPTLRDVADVTDHAAGSAPYYAPGGGSTPFQ